MNKRVIKIKLDDIIEKLESMSYVSTKLGDPMINIENDPNFLSLKELSNLINKK